MQEKAEATPAESQVGTSRVEASRGGAGRVVRLGTFDAEAWWRPGDLAALPAVGSGSDSAVDAMDELLAGFCDPGDLLITRRPMAAPVLEGLAAAFGGSVGEGLRLGPAFEHLALGDPGGGPVERHVLADQRVMNEIRGATIAPYAVLPDTWTLAEQLLPAPEVVAKVNSKSWSNELVRRLGLPGAGRVVRSVEELATPSPSLNSRL